MNKTVGIFIIIFLIIGAMVFLSFMGENNDMDFVVILFIMFVGFIADRVYPKNEAAVTDSDFLNQQRNENELKEQQRKKALKDAQIYLKPYKDIYDNLELKNRYCSLKLKNGVISGKELYSPDTPDSVMHREFIIKNSNVFSIDELWNMFCKYFTYNVHYEGLIEIANKFKANINEKVELNVVKKSSGSNQKIAKADKIDINNCSEMEMTSLSGINIVMAKKAIKKREEIGGFKSADDFILFLHIKPHLADNLRRVIYVSKMKGQIQKPLNTERSVDL